MIQHNLLDQLKPLEPDAEFTGIPPRIQSSSGNQYFAKMGSTSETEQYVGEVESLKAIETAAPGLAPRVLSLVINHSGNPVFISEYKDLVPLQGSSSIEALAKRLALELHASTSTNGFGFHVPTFCGATKLSHGWYDSWENCYSNMIGELLKQLRSSKSYRVLCHKGEKVKNCVIPKLLGPLKIHPVLLHGDLWNGNVGVDKIKNQPVIFDPSSFYGHNEADLAIARIFGGFTSSFFETYHKYHPKSEPVHEYRLRGDLYELFHYLNHTVLFGGDYANSSEKIMDQLLGAV